MPSEFAPITDAFARKYKAFADKLLREARKLMREDATLTIDKAVSAAYRKIGGNAVISEAIAVSAASAAVKAGGLAVESSANFATWYLDKSFGGTTLSQKVADARLLTEINTRIRAALKAQKSWTATADALLRPKRLIKAKLPGYLDDLVSGARAMSRAADNLEILRRTKKAVAKATAQIDKLAAAGAPTGRLKAAYQDLARAAIKGSEAGVKQAVQKAIYEKSRYHAERIARTEIARAYSVSFHTAVAQDVDVVGVRSVLSTRHPRPDICNFHAEADLYGMGSGVYPTDSLPPYPYHLQCLCILHKVFDAPKPRARVRTGAQEYLRNQPLAKQKALLGSQGRDSWVANPRQWDKHLKHWNGHQPPPRGIPKSIKA